MAGGVVVPLVTKLFGAFRSGGPPGAVAPRAATSDGGAADDPPPRALVRLRRGRLAHDPACARVARRAAPTSCGWRSRASLCAHCMPLCLVCQCAPGAAGVPVAALCARCARAHVDAPRRAPRRAAALPVRPRPAPRRARRRRGAAAVDGGADGCRRPRGGDAARGARALAAASSPPSAPRPARSRARGARALLRLRRLRGAAPVRHRLRALCSRRRRASRATCIARVQANPARGVSYYADGRRARRTRARGGARAPRCGGGARTGPSSRRRRRSCALRRPASLRGPPPAPAARPAPRRLAAPCAAPLLRCWRRRSCWRSWRRTRRRALARAPAPPRCRARRRARGARVARSRRVRRRRRRRRRRLSALAEGGAKADAPFCGAQTRNGGSGAGGRGGGRDRGARRAHPPPATLAAHCASQLQPGFSALRTAEAAALHLAVVGTLVAARRWRRRRRPRHGSAPQRRPAPARVPRQCRRGC